MTKPKVFVARFLAQEALDRIAQVTEMEVWPEELPPPYEMLLEKAKDAEGLVTLVTDKVDAALMDAAPSRHSSSPKRSRFTARGSQGTGH